MPNVLRRGSITVRRVLPLGTGAVTTATYPLGSTPIKGRIKGVRYSGSAAVTGTAITADVQRIATDGNSATSVQSAATDVKITSGTDKTTLSATLASNGSGTLDLPKNTQLQVVVTANAITAGPGDLVVEVDIEPRA